MSIFGPVVHGGDVEAAALDTLQTWLPTYLAELGERAGHTRGALALPRSWTVASGIDERFPENALPALAVSAPSLSGEPERRGDGTVWASYGLGVGIVVTASTQVAVESLSRIYTAAVRVCLLQKKLPTLAGFEGINWIAESYDEVDVPREKRRSLASGIVSFDVQLSQAVDVFAGPTEPAPRAAPHVYDASLPTVLTADVTVSATDEDL